jgi:hypothetical protein
MFVCLALMTGLDAHGQDALAGKRLYLDAARLRGSGVSCVDCHGGLPGGAFGIGRAANDPAVVERAVNSIPQMAPLRGRLTSQDTADLAAYIGNPAVPSPVLAIATAARDAAPAAADRVDFGRATMGQGSVRARVVFSNSGALALTWSSPPRIVGPHAADFAITSSGCIDGQPLASGAACEIDIAFRPAESAAGPRTAALQIDHDWVSGTAAVALLGTSESSAAVAPVSAAGGGGGATGQMLCGFMIAVSRLRASAASRRRGA